ncbi:hypothetical protein B296_00050607 [Ensete ventricosum]|uniref:Uncharacterized protein n=1 Tax=Ensete ventricosum TaxID=4639 RepID=A0A426XMX3_ENSVE|nr:hypothetical protein B296_00050607 [Ensete ventricosum]
MVCGQLIVLTHPPDNEWRSRADMPDLPLTRLTVDRPRKLPEERSRAAISLDPVSDPVHTGNLIKVIRHPTLRDDPNILTLEGGPMSQDRIFNLFPSRVTEEAVPPAPTAMTMPHITVAPPSGAR